MTQVVNAADRKQVEHAGRKDKTRRQRELASIKVMLSTPEGRAALWGFISFCRVHQEPMSGRGDLDQRHIGMQRVGNFMIGEINEADDRLWELMAREAKQRARSDEVEAEAVRTKSATDKLKDEDAHS